MMFIQESNWNHLPQNGSISASCQKKDVLFIWLIQVMKSKRPRHKKRSQVLKPWPISNQNWLLPTMRMHQMRFQKMTHTTSRCSNEQTITKRSFESADPQMDAQVCSTTHFSNSIMSARLPRRKKALMKQITNWNCFSWLNGIESNKWKRRLMKRCRRYGWIGRSISCTSWWWCWSSTWSISRACTIGERTRRDG